MGRLSRHDHNRIITCAASNTNITSPAVSTAQLKLACKNKFIIDKLIMFYEVYAVIIYLKRFFLLLKTLRFL